MPKPATALTVKQVENAKPRAKPYKLAAGRSLSMLVLPNGTKSWRFKYRFGGVEKGLTFGTFPQVSLAAARIERDKAIALKNAGTDPSEARKQIKATQRIKQRDGADTFEAAARDWLTRQTVSPKTLSKKEWILKSHVFPEIGKQPIGELALLPARVRDAIRAIEAKGIHETARRAKMLTGAVFAYAVEEGRAKANPVPTRGNWLMKPLPEKHHAAIVTPSEVGALMRAIDDFDGQAVTRAALRLAPLVFVRPGELRGAEWAEFDLDSAEPIWRIGAARMKMKIAHLVPLSKQAVAILSDIKRLTGSGRLVFPGLRSVSRPISENTINAALRRLGYSTDEMTGHGFRSTASTLLNELGYAPDAIERQLAHVEPNKVRDAYNHAKYLPERSRMMQAWSDYLDALKAGGNVLPFARKAG